MSRLYIKVIYQGYISRLYIKVIYKGRPFIFNVNIICCLTQVHLKTGTQTAGRVVQGWCVPYNIIRIIRKLHPS